MTYTRINYTLINSLSPRELTKCFSSTLSPKKKSLSEVLAKALAELLSVRVKKKYRGITEKLNHYRTKNPAPSPFDVIILISYSIQRHLIILNVFSHLACLNFVLLASTTNADGKIFRHSRRHRTALTAGESLEFTAITSQKSGFLLDFDIKLIQDNGEGGFLTWHINACQENFIKLRKNLIS